VTCRHCHAEIPRTASWYQVHLGRRVVDCCSLACVDAVVTKHAAKAAA
jgi:hypothetical protein